MTTYKMAGQDDTACGMPGASKTTTRMQGTREREGEREREREREREKRRERENVVHVGL